MGQCIDGLVDGLIMKEKKGKLLKMGEGRQEGAWHYHHLEVDEALLASNVYVGSVRERAKGSKDSFQG